jgi:hypothetical protein
MNNNKSEKHARERKPIPALSIPAVPYSSIEVHRDGRWIKVRRKRIWRLSLARSSLNQLNLARPFLKPLCLIVALSCFIWAVD